MVRYCSDWNPDDWGRMSRKPRYSDGVRVSSTDLGELAQHLLAPGQALELADAVLAQVRDGRAQLMDHQLHPQAGDADDP